ncbi:MAG: hypothetical protein IPN79_08115 [Saprospiraceae bacterium]|nr:hypothetical protein [Saprospiraceae bacterium]
MDNKNLIVKGNDFNFEDSIVSHYRSVPTAIRLLSNFTFEDGYRIHGPDLQIHPVLEYKICHCRDTVWAKKQLLQEVARRYPYHIVDSIEKHKVYDMTFLDTSYFGTPSFRNIYHLGFSVSEDGKTLTKFNQEYPSIVSGTLFTSFENKGNRVHIRNITPEYLRYQRYDVQFPYQLYDAENISISDYSQYLKDSMGIVITLAEEYTIPIKVIQLKGK